MNLDAPLTETSVSLPSRDVENQRSTDSEKHELSVVRVNLANASLREEDVRAFQIAVQDLMGVDVLQSHTNMYKPVHDLNIHASVAYAW